VAREERQTKKIRGNILRGGIRVDAMSRPSHKDDFLEKTKAAGEEKQMEKIGTR